MHKIVAAACFPWPPCEVGSDDTTPVAACTSSSSGGSGNDIGFTTRPSSINKVARRLIFEKGHEKLDLQTDERRKKIRKFKESAWKCVYFLSAEIFLKNLFHIKLVFGINSAYKAFFVTQTLRALARDGRTMIASIHQPSSEVFKLFDQLYLLSGGKTVYFGHASAAYEFFAQAEFPCPALRNPSDHFLRCINSDFDKVKATLKGSMKLRVFRSCTRRCSRSISQHPARFAA
ncbi:hypothetical protein HN51_065383 [Arachis hypogaea]|uniref:ATP-binding cassette sub-family G member 4-like n=1 Tax=Arachis ipaensis TaxID=130454 RepID=UPI0007AFDE99|nr:ATP-binding cassette sub-family G member 4-like [Arachis ipaensis]XP_020976420.1 ATP-binding cassette sub-family G member 4-like [Arachis ipaensis]XP_025646358.1 ATP-binding cassette sub-family G member 4 [Arachis hypogaea]